MKLLTYDGIMETSRIILRPWKDTEALGLMIDSIRKTTGIQSLISGLFVDNSASGRVMEKCGFLPTGETVIDETQYNGAGRPIRVLRLEL